MSQETPSKSSEQRKTEYRKLLDLAEILQEDEETGLATAQAIDKILTEANILFKDGKIKDRIKHTDEVLLDAKLLATASDVLYNVTEAIDVAVDSYEPAEFGSRIRNKLLTSNDELDGLQWHNLFETVRGIMKCPPNYSYLYGGAGTVDPSQEPKVKKPRQKKSIQKNEQVLKKQPEKVTSVDKEEDSVDDTVKFLQWALNKEYDENGGKPMNYFHFLIHPDNFTTSIENMFHLSFLVRDGRVKLIYDENGILIVAPISSTEVKKARKDKIPYKQSIISIDVEEWKEVIEKFKIKTYFLDKWKPKWEEKKSKAK